MRRGYREMALARIHNVLDEFYMRQEVDWDYDVRRLLDQILEIALKHLEFGEEGRKIDRALIIVKPESGEELEVTAGWSREGDDLAFSRTIVGETIKSGKPELYENASRDPRFMNAESLKELEVVSLMSVPIRSESGLLGAIYIERNDPSHIFTSEDIEYLEQFAGTIASYIKTALLHQEHVAEIRKLRTEGEKGAELPNILGRSQAMKKVLGLARIAAGVDKTVLITGESGCGKELLAQAIHAQSQRADKPFIVVDCSGLSDSLLESELFGHTKGAFTGATSEKPGAFEAAEGGTVFLDEISDAPKAMQQQLRRVLQEGQIRRVGENHYRKVDVRVVCATNRNLREESEQDRFIHDLFHRIHQFPIRLPPLRERREDIPTLVQHFISGSGARKNPPVLAIDPDALSLLVARDYRANNVRELQNLVEFALDLASGGRITIETVRLTLELREDSDTDSTSVASMPAPAATETPEYGAPKHEATPPPLGSLAVLPSQLAHSPGDFVALDREVARLAFDRTSESDEKEDRPYYRAQREFSGKLIVESLRYCGWKLRPAARLLGVSPVKLRQDFRSFLELSVSTRPDESDLAESLGIPAETLKKKLDDLGISSNLTKPSSS